MAKQFAGHRFTRRRQLRDEYKALEHEALMAVFKDHDDFHTWSKMAVLRGCVHEYDSLDNNLRNDTADKLLRAAELRTEAIPLWPTGGDAERRHWDWVDILRRMAAILRTDNVNDEIPDRTAIVEAAPAAVAEDEKSWMDVDLDICLKQMNHWRQTLADIWQMAIDDPKQMSVADISTGCAIRYFKLELASMKESYEEWYDEFGSYTDKTLEYMEKRDPDGFGGDLSKVLQSLKDREVQDIENELKKADITNLPPVSPVWFMGDRGRHIDPLINWVRDIIERTKKDGHTTSNAEFLLAWLMISDSVKLSQEHLQQIKSAAVRRLAGMSRVIESFQDLFGTSIYAQGLQNDMAARVNAMNRYVSNQDSLLSIAVAVTWADYANVLINVFLSTLPLSQEMVLIFDTNMILKRWTGLPIGSQVEQFCNKYKDYLYPNGRPQTEGQLKNHITDWQQAGHNLTPTLIIYKLTTIEEVDKYKKDWVRIELIEDHLTVQREDFEETQGSTKWWEAIKKRTAEELQVPSLAPIYAKFHRDNNKEEVLKVLKVIVKNQLKRKKRLVGEALDKVKFAPDLFDGILDSP